MQGIDTTVQDGVATVTIDRAPVNALTTDGWEELAATINELSADMSVRAVVLTGANGHFSAGADVEELANPPSEQDAAMLRTVGKTAAAIRECRVPVIASAEGASRGGGFELLLACDVVVASPKASFASSAVNMGVIATVPALSATVGPKRASMMLLTGEPIDAAKASEWGVVSTVADDPLGEAQKIANRIASRGPLAVEANKVALQAFGHVGPEEHTALVTLLCSRLERSADHTEAVEAFLQKRSASFDRQ